MNETTKKSDSVPNPQTDSPIKSIKFIHQKGGEFRVFHADGGWGLMTRDGNIQIEFYTEHQPMPTAVIQPLGTDGNLSDEFQVEGVSDPIQSRQATMVREFQVGIIVQIPAAVQLHALLGNFISQLTQQMPESTK